MRSGRSFFDSLSIELKSAVEVTEAATQDARKQIVDKEAPVEKRSMSNLHHRKRRRIKSSPHLPLKVEFQEQPMTTKHYRQE